MTVSLRSWIRGEDLADPIRQQGHDAGRALRQPLLAPTGQVMAGTVVLVVADTDLGDDPPTARMRLSDKREGLADQCGLGQPVLEATHWPLHDLAVDQLDVLIAGPG